MHRRRRSAAGLGVGDAFVASLMRQLLLGLRGIFVGQMRECVKRSTLLHAEQTKHGHEGNEGETQAAKGVHINFHDKQNIQDFRAHVRCDRILTNVRDNSVVTPAI